MAISYTIDTDRGIIWTIAAGRLTDEQLTEHKRALLRDPVFQADMKEMSDVRAVETFDVTPDGIREFAEFDMNHKDHIGSHQLALLVPTDFAFGMARMYEMFTEDSSTRVHVFRDETEARKWLGIADADSPFGPA